MLDLANLTPHGFCLAWDPALLWLQAGSDALIALAYYSIPLALVWFARRRRDLAFSWIFVLFAAFILACGTTHILGVITLWAPAYWTEGVLKALTAILSVTTAIALWPLLPRAISIPSQTQLQALNAQLSSEITERKAIADRLRISEARLQSLYTRTPMPLHTVDLDCRVVAVSDQWLELLGYTREDVIGTDITRYHTPESELQRRLDRTALIRDGIVRDCTHTLIHRDGSTRPVLASATLERDETGAPAFVIAALADVTERRKTEAALAVSEAHLRQAQKMEAVGQLTGGIAHDFNNMLTAVNCVMELLQKRLPEHDSSRHLVSSVLEAANRAAKLTGQLLAFSRRQRLVSEPLDPLDVVRNMGHLLTRPLGEHVALAIDSAVETPWRILADRNQFEAALLNLVLNARAAIEGEGRIRIEIAHIPADRVEHAVELSLGEDPLDGRDYVAVTIADTGHGMSEDTRRQAFEPFFTTKPVGQGTGLGLSQTYGFARQSGGTVRIESTEGVGTRVTIILPRATEQAHPPVVNAPASARAGRGETILFVEDEDTLRDVAVAALQEFGFRVVPARNADEALALVGRGQSFDILFTDILMPGTRNGVELAIELRRRAPDLPVLFATGYTDRKILDDWHGRLEILTKPYSVDAVARAIAAARTPALA